MALLLHLLWSVVTTTIVSTALSIWLLLRSILHRLVPLPKYEACLYQGTVFHERRRPVHHSFCYPVRYALFDLGLSSHSTTLSISDCRRVAQTNGPVKLLTIPQNVGYEMNPLSVYFCYDCDEDMLKLRKCIAEVTNTPWGEKVMFVFDPNSDTVAKPLHVSPFMDMSSNWVIEANDPDDKLSVIVRAHHPEMGAYFFASLQARRVSPSNHALFFWLMPHLVALRIYWNAVALWWKKVAVVSHPKYCISTYRDDAVARDCRLREQPPDTSKRRRRWIEWRDAKWPWC